MSLYLPSSSSPTSSRSFEFADAKDLLSLAVPGTVQVLAAAPGQRKSTYLRMAVGEAIIAGTVSRVLWATQSIVTSSALGAEALKDFGELRTPAEIVYGHAAFTARQQPGRFQDQFTWPARPMVKIVSHARVRRIFGGSDPDSAGLRGADLLVIDEDPTSSLVLASPTQVSDKDSPTKLESNRISELARSGDPVLQALDQMTRLPCLPAHTEHFVLRNGFERGHAVFGRPFWRMFLDEHPQAVDEISLGRALKSAGVDGAEHVARAFAEDAQHAASHLGFRTRIGFHWPGLLPEPALVPEQTLLRFNVRHPLDLNLPTIILDGYADRNLYKTLFAEQRIEVYAFAPAPALDIEYAPMLRVHRLNTGDAAGSPHQLQVAEELASQRQRQLKLDPLSKQLIITNKALQDPGSPWQGLLKQAYTARGLNFCQADELLAGGVTDMHQMYWHSGRGRNEHAGSDVFALTPPNLSRMNRDYALAALFPDDPVERERLQAHNVGAELLQMLNRGRQNSWSPAVGGAKPRVVVAATERQIQQLLGDLHDRAVLRPFRPMLRHTPHSKQPRWRDMITALARELLPDFPEGLPIELLQALPKYARSRTADRTEIHEKLAALALSRPTGSHLYQAFHDPAAWIYSDVTAGGGRNDGLMLKEAMQDLDLHPDTQPGKRGRPLVYLPTGGDAGRATAAFESWRSTSATSTPAPGSPSTPVHTTLSSDSS